MSCPHTECQSYANIPLFSYLHSTFGRGAILGRFIERRAGLGGDMQVHCLLNGSHSCISLEQHICKILKWLLYQSIQACLGHCVQHQFGRVVRTGWKVTTVCCKGRPPSSIAPSLSSFYNQISRPIHDSAGQQVPGIGAATSSFSSLGSSSSPNLCFSLREVNGQRLRSRVIYFSTFLGLVFVR